MKLILQVFLMMFAFLVAVVAIGYFYHFTVTPNPKLPFITPNTPIAESTPTPTHTPTPTPTPTPVP